MPHGLQKVFEETGKVLEQGAQVGEYVIDGKIAEGGMGAVYAGHHPIIGKRVAVKVLAPQCASIPDLVRRFVEEARAVNKIGHPNIIDIFSFGTLSDGRPYFVMEYLDGASLGHRIEQGTLTADETRRLLRQICSALEAAHRAGIVHRDLKPENIWVASPSQEESYAKVLDFGIAKLLDAGQAGKTQTGAAMGTPRYMAPEQCMGRAVGPKADLYSFGVILYELYAGTAPFRGQTFGELVYQHMSEIPEPPSKHRPIDPALEKIILACLEKDPQRRPESAKDLSQRLELALGGGGQPAPTGVAPAPAAGGSAPTGGPVTTMAQSIGEVVPRPAAPRRTKRVAVTVGTAVLVVIGGALLSRGRRPAPTTATPPAESPARLPAAAASPPSGRLRLHIADGPAERVSLDGREVARDVGDVDLGDVAPGPHVVSIEAAGRPPQIAPVNVAAGAPTTLSIALPPAERPTHGVTRHGAGPRKGSGGQVAAGPGDGPASRPSTAGAHRKPSRATEHGLMDENPFRQP